MTWLNEESYAYIGFYRFCNAGSKLCFICFGQQQQISAFWRGKLEKKGTENDGGSHLYVEEHEHVPNDQLGDVPQDRGPRQVAEASPHVGVGLDAGWA